MLLWVSEVPPFYCGVLFHLFISLFHWPLVALWDVSSLGGGLGIKLL